eukprot:augustus_masked-scaffold_13-processed-gene-8.26-mRNA-1 protein AED:1.00 eAED:1.00 QI:0/0/0/0/1/1/2/0/406
MTSSGLAVASIKYHYLSTVLWLTQFNDIISALNFLADERNAYDFGLDLSRIALWGKSSGAHLALMASLMVKEITMLRLNTSAVVSWFGISDLYRLISDADIDAAEEHTLHTLAEEELLGLNRLTENRKAFNEATPVFLINHTEIDYNRAQEITGRGFTVAVMNWRYSSTDPWPAQRDDVVEALSFLIENCELYKLNVSKVAIWGQSSGEHHALFGSLLSENLTTSHLQVAATISWFAPSDQSEMMHDAKTDSVPGPDEDYLPAEDPQLGVPHGALVKLSLIQKKKPIFDEASPTAYIQGMLPGQETCDFLLIHGTADQTVSPFQTWRLFHLLKEQGRVQHLATRLVIENWHGGPGFFFETQPSIDFISQSFGLGTFNWSRNNDDIPLLLLGDNFSWNPDDIGSKLL